MCTLTYSVYECFFVEFAFRSNCKVADAGEECTNLEHEWLSWPFKCRRHIFYDP